MILRHDSCSFCILRYVRKITHYFPSFLPYNMQPSNEVTSWNDSVKQVPSFLLTQNLYAQYSPVYKCLHVYMFIQNSCFSFFHFTMCTLLTLLCSQVYYPMLLLKLGNGRHSCVKNTVHYMFKKKKKNELLIQYYTFHTCNVTIPSYLTQWFHAPYSVVLSVTLCQIHYFTFCFFFLST